MTGSRSDGTEDAGRPSDRRLTGWKEIAEHLGTSVATAQRWERELALPVRRLAQPPGSAPRTVFAIVSEVDAWLTRPRSPEAVPAPRTAGPPRAIARSRIGALVMILGAIGILLVAVNARMESHDAPGGAVFAVEFRDGTEVVAFAQDGGEVWSHAFPGPLPPVTSNLDRTVWSLRDLDGDGTSEVILIGPWSATIEALDDDGAPLWSFDPGTGDPSTAGHAGGRRQIDAMATVAGPGGGQVAVTHRSLAVPEQVLTVLDARGGNVWSGPAPIAVTSLLAHDVEDDGIEELLLAGHAKDDACAVLLILRLPGAGRTGDALVEVSRLEIGPSSTSLAAGRSLTTGVPRAHSGAFLIDVITRVPSMPERWLELAPDLEPLSMGASDQLASLHATLRADGVVDGPFDEERSLANTLRFLPSGTTTARR